MTKRLHDGLPAELSETETDAVQGGAQTIKLARTFVAKRSFTFAAELAPSGGIEGSDIGSGG